MYGRPAELQQLATLGEVVGDGDRVDRLPAAVQVDDRVEEGLVRRPVEIDAAKDLDDVGDGVLGQKHGSEDRLLSRQVLRRNMAKRTRIRLERRSSSHSDHHPTTRAETAVDHVGRRGRSFACVLQRHQRSFSTRPPVVGVTLIEN